MPKPYTSSVYEIAQLDGNDTLSPPPQQPTLRQVQVTPPAHVEEDLVVGPLLSPISNPPSPDLNPANLSDFLPYIDYNDDEGFDESIEQDFTEEQDQLIQVITGTSGGDNTTIYQDWGGSQLTQGWREDTDLSHGWNNNPTLPEGWRQGTNNTTVRRDNRVLLAAQLPTIFVTNHRSFFPKFFNFIEAMKTLDLALGLHSEIWERLENKMHQNKIEEALQLEGIKYISNPRPTRRGGGAAITLIEGNFTLVKLDVIVPKNLEVVWGLVRPKEPTSQFKGILVCSFYSPPYSTKKNQLIEHITINYAALKVKFKNTFFIVGGDRNDLELKKLTNISPSFHTLNTKPTHGIKNIDVIVTDMTHLFGESVIIPNVKTDIPDGHPGGGKPSDHPIVYSRPRTNMVKQPEKEVIIKKIRRFNEDQKRLVGKWIQRESWEEVFDSSSSSRMAVKFQEVVFRNLDKICPEEEVRLSKYDSKITSKALQIISRQKLREYTKHGNSQKFKELKKKQQERIKVEATKQLNKQIDKAGGKGMQWIQEAKRISARPGEDVSPSFTLPGHLDENLTPEQSAERIVAYFSKISQEYKPIEEDVLAEDLQNRLDHEACYHPPINEEEVYQTMLKSKKTDTVPGDIPAPILKEFLPELALPVSIIIKEAVSTHTWPDDYKKEYHLPLKKCPLPQTEDDLRGIGLTNWISKQLERFLLNWIWPYIKPHIDPDQMGGMPGCSIEHYIIKMMHFVFKSMDGNPDAAVLAVPVDYSKAFNRMLHSNILNIVAELSPPVPICAIKLLKSYLTKRSMCIRYKQATSSFQQCPGGGPQGGLLTGILFCLQVNKAGHPCKLPAPLAAPEKPEGQEPPKKNPIVAAPTSPGQPRVAAPPQMNLLVTAPPPPGQPGVEAPPQMNPIVAAPPSPWQPGVAAPPKNNPIVAAPPSPGQPGVTAPPQMNPIVPAAPAQGQLPLCHNSNRINKNAFVDDLTLLEKISLSRLVQKERIIGPPQYHGRFHLMQPRSESILQHQLEDLVEYTKLNSMVLNSKKTKCLPFNMSRTKDFIPELSVEEGTNLEVIYSMKLVGMMISSDLTQGWQSHVDYTVNRINKVLWQLVRFKQLGGDREKLLTFYTLKVRSILMFGAVCYHSGLTVEQSGKLELQQKKCLAIILGREYTNYENARRLVQLPRLDTLRESQCLKWAIKTQSNKQHSHLFPLCDKERVTRQNQQFREYKCRGARFYKSAVPAMIRSLNKNNVQPAGIPGTISITTNSGQVIYI